MDTNTTVESSVMNISSNISVPLNHMAPPTIPLYIFILVTTSYSVVFLAGILGNVLVILVVALFSDMRTSTNVYLANLSIADSLVLLICLPSALTEFHSEEVWHLGDFMCRFTYFVENLVSSASVLTIIAVTIDRYIAVCKPLHAQSTCTPTRAFKVVIGIWLTSMATALPFFVTAHTTYIQYYDDTFRPTCTSPIDQTWKQIYVVTLLMLFFFIPLTILFLLYLRIGIRVRRESIRFRGSNNTHITNAHGNRQQVLYLLVSIVVLFFVFLLPIRIIIIMNSLAPTKNGLHNLTFEEYLLVMSFARIMFYLNSACNPIVYSMVSKKFRNAFKRAFRRKLGRHNTYGSTHGSSFDNGSTVRTSMTLRKSLTLKSTAQVKPETQPLKYKITMI